MSVRENGGQIEVAFQHKHKRVHRRMPPGTTIDEAQAIERMLRREIFKAKELGVYPDRPVPEVMDASAESSWLMVANLLLRATGIQPRPGVYFLCDKERLLYVGQSRNVATRLAGHHGKGYDRAVMIELPIKELIATERYLIKMLKPPLNGRPPGGALVGSLADSGTDGHPPSEGKQSVRRVA